MSKHISPDPETKLLMSLCSICALLIIGIGFANYNGTYDSSITGMSINDVLQETCDERLDAAIVGGWSINQDVTFSKLGCNELYTEEELDDLGWVENKCKAGNCNVHIEPEEERIQKEADSNDEKEKENTKKEVLSTCTDSDSGINYNERGTTKGQRFFLNTARVDYCLGKNLFEYYCSEKDKIKLDFKRCGFKCGEGRCINEEQDEEEEINKGRSNEKGAEPKKEVNTEKTKEDNKETNKEEEDNTDLIIEIPETKESGIIYYPPLGKPIDKSSVTFKWTDTDALMYTFYVAKCDITKKQGCGFGSGKKFIRNSEFTVPVELDGKNIYVFIDAYHKGDPLDPNAPENQLTVYQYSTIKKEGCGNGILEEGESCELNQKEIQCTTYRGYKGRSSCSDDCKLGCITSDSCGDGIINGQEGCDDGNAIDGDGCSSACMVELDFDIISYDDFDVRDNTLVIYNENAVDAKEIAKYYIEKRDISNNALCGVKAPNGHYIHKDHFLGMRKTILEKCICPKISDKIGSGECSIHSVGKIAEYSPITHLVLIKGLPGRLTGTGWASDSEEPSMDFYLSYYLYNQEDIFKTGSTGDTPRAENYYSGHLNNGLDFQTENPMYAYSRGLVPKVDKIVAYGRIEAITTQRTKELIDRTLLAEGKGLQGNVFIAKSINKNKQPYDLDDYDITQFLSYTFSSRNQECLNAEDNWNKNCKVALEPSGQIPGEIYKGKEITRIPSPINAQIFLGSSPFADRLNGGNTAAHRAFDGFNNMIKWHKDEVRCTELCDQFTNDADRQKCKEQSKDYFKEINTECVGVAPGFLANQVRSWTVQHYGFWPDGWSIVSGGNGAKERTPLQFMDKEGFQNEIFTDKKFIRFGQKEILGSTCLVEDGSEEACEEYAVTNIRKSIKLDQAINIDETYSFTLKIRHRNPGNNGRLYARLYAYSEGKKGYTAPAVYTSFENENKEWATWEEDLIIDNSFDKTTRLLLDIYTTFSNSPKGWVDLDAIELIDKKTGKSLIDVDSSSFNRDQKSTMHGDWPANVIDRLGGIGAWGSSSHHLTGGFAFAGSTTNTFPDLLSGRTLGESLARTYLHMSGLIYADPLYQPSAAKLYSEIKFNEIGNPNQFFAFNSNSVKNIFFNAWHGKKNMQSVNWEISTCKASKIEECNDQNAWESVKRGQGAQQRSNVNINLRDFAPKLSDKVILRLRVWNSGEESQEIKNYAFFENR